MSRGRQLAYGSPDYQQESIWVLKTVKQTSNVIKCNVNDLKAHEHKGRPCITWFQTGAPGGPVIDVLLFLLLRKACSPNKKTAYGSVLPAQHKTYHILLTDMRKKCKCNTLSLLQKETIPQETDPECWKDMQQLQILAIDYIKSLFKWIHTACMALKLPMGK